MQNNKRDINIREIAYSVYLENKKKGILDNPEANWLKAESIYNNKIRYFCYRAIQFVKKYKFVLIILAIPYVPYILDLYYRPTLIVDFIPFNISQDNNGDWLADYQFSIEGNQNLVLPKRIIISYDDRMIIPNSHPNMPGGKIGSASIHDAKSLALIWDINNSVIQHNRSFNRSIGLLTRARLKDKRTILPTQIEIYVEVEPHNLYFLRLFYRTRLYKGSVYYNIDFSKIGQSQKINVELK